MEHLSATVDAARRPRERPSAHPPASVAASSLASTSASVPSSSARLPSTPGTISRPRAVAGIAWRCTCSRNGSRSTSPAALSSPPTTINSGFRRSHSVATAVPMCRPASASTRRAPESPDAAAASRPWVVRSGPCVPRSSSRSAAAPASVSRQPRFPHRHTGPCSWMIVWPISPAIPPDPWNSRPFTISPAPIPVDTFRYAAFRQPAAAPQRCSASAPRLASLSTYTGIPSRALNASAARTPTQPGRIDEDPTRPERMSIGPGSPSPTPITSRRGTSAAASTSSTSSEAVSRPVSAGSSVRVGRSAEARMVWLRSAAATRRWRFPKSIPTAAPAERLKDRSRGGRPPCGDAPPPCGDPPARSSRSLSMPSPWSSLTMLATVVRESPVRRASSGRLAAPASRSAATTRARLRSRRTSGPAATHWTHSRRGESMRSGSRVKAAVGAAVIALIVGVAGGAGGVAPPEDSSDERAREPARDRSHRNIERQIDRLVSRMTLQEKLQQVTLLPDFKVTEADARNGLGAVLSETRPERIRELQRIAVEESRLGIPLLFAFDTIHGFRTIFPIPLGTGASFDPQVAFDDAKFGARESAAVGLKQTYAPMVDVSHEPRWGRIAEAAGEDPFLNSAMAVERVKGTQGEDYSARDKLLASPKHFA